MSPTCKPFNSIVNSFRYHLIYWCAAGKIHISEATKAALDSSCAGGFEVELRGETDVKVSQVTLTSGSISHYNYIITSVLWHRTSNFIICSIAIA